MSEEIGKEILDRVDINDNIESQVTTAKDILGQGSITEAESNEVVDTPTPIAAGTANKFAGIGIILVVGLLIWYFFFRRK